MDPLEEHYQRLHILMLSCIADALALPYRVDLPPGEKRKEAQAIMEAANIARDAISGRQEEG